MKKVISTNQAPPAVGPYSQAVMVNDTVYLAGQIPLTPERELITDSIENQVHQVMKNLKAVLNEAELDFSNVVKTEIFLTDLADYEAVNKVYAGYMSEPYPARYTVQVAGLPKGVGVEISMTAVKD